MLAAIRTNCLEQVQSVVDDDEAFLHMPLFTGNGCESPVFVAIKQRCSVGLLDFLLRSGASAHEKNSAGFTALEVLAGAKTGQPPLRPRADAWNAAHTPAWLSGQVPRFPGFKARPAALPQLPLDTSRSDKCLCALAACLLSHGVQAGKAVAIAEEAGQAALASLIRYWEDRKLCRWLRAVYARSAVQVALVGGRSLFDCPADVCEAICEFLAPPN